MAILVVLILILGIVVLSAVIKREKALSHAGRCGNCGKEIA